MLFEYHGGFTVGGMKKREQFNYIEVRPIVLFFGAQNMVTVS